MSTNDNSEKDSPFNVWWVVSGIVLILVIVGLVIVLIFGPGKGGNNAGHPTPGPMPSSSNALPNSAGSSNSAGDSACDLPAGDDIPTSAPAAEWSNRQLFIVPSSKEFGPVSIPGSEWGCYSHSPSGALFAAANFVAGLGDEKYESFMREASLNNESLDSYLATTSPGSHKQEPGLVGQIAGFQFVGVEDDVVIVNLAVKLNDITGAFKIGLVWDQGSGTWKADVSRSDLTLRTTELTAYTPWNATNG
ncbi:hypothetical protein ITJ38_17625 [Agreia pratensis]|uniref:hypothetical protein n=1 Tax=Agreia pratensis TaxID=150121 RepID=UPI00188A7CE8|nr:hypothetical protein [Agreia pratensis]MBF4636234.1 hypothetical protein [Agreia pratensis]